MTESHPARASWRAGRAGVPDDRLGFALQARHRKAPPRVDVRRRRSASTTSSTRCPSEARERSRLQDVGLAGSSRRARGPVQSATTRGPRRSRTTMQAPQVDKLSVEGELFAYFVIGEGPDRGPRRGQPLHLRTTSPTRDLRKWYSRTGVATEIVRESAGSRRLGLTAQRSRRVGSTAARTFASRKSKVSTSKPAKKVDVKRETKLAQLRSGRLRLRPLDRDLHVIAQMLLTNTDRGEERTASSRCC